MHMSFFDHSGAHSLSRPNRDYDESGGVDGQYTDTVNNADRSCG